MRVHKPNQICVTLNENGIKDGQTNALAMPLSKFVFNKIVNVILVFAFSRLTGALVVKAPQRLNTWIPTQQYSICVDWISCEIIFQKRFF